MKLKIIQDPKDARLVIKLSHQELEDIKDRAKLYAEGNTSLWIRYAATKHKPRAEDLEFEE